MTLRKTLFIASLTLLPLTVQAADEADTVNFVVPPWPGVTVKTEIVAKLIDDLGYRANRIDMSSTVGYSTLQSGDTDVFLGGWLPAQQKIYDAAIQSDAIVDLGNNVEGARMGFAVPGYVHDAGITSAAQLNDPENRKRFDGEFYSIESGSTVSESINDAVNADVYGLGDWNIRESSTAGMLAEVDAAARDERWIVFYGWTPHWMAPKYDMAILDDPESVYGKENGKSDIRTIVRRDFSEANPNLTKLLDQVVFSAEEQSRFIDEFSQQEKNLEDVAEAWIEDHPDQIRAFLEGVTRRDGQPAQDAIQ
ncbi:glycine betaine ABC transporter substrate-binding protein [Halomonas sp. M20]|uniref:glycine betaine ABC transporter substrate-binding protein n=1 Tax=Halomonas sp. M20 TaxID=2763264 RepID=UPI001D0AD819|nr:glycine betaine ABC transporter substrate-binding protein [Halomonas sp. M20]